MIVDHYSDKWREYLPVAPGTPWYPHPTVPVPPPSPPVLVRPVSPEEVEEFRRLLERAREYDKKNSEPECELEEKKRTLKSIADALGVRIDFL